MMNGEHKQWHENGQLSVQCHYANGKMEGEYKEWHPDGELMEHDVYVYGESLGLEMGSLTDKDRFELTLIYGVKWL